jgi:glycosyltransferase involved in cell wall biosynthesis
LARTLESVPVGSPVLVVDAESSDETAELARARGAEVVVRPWPGFIAQRRFAADCVRTPWTFMLDADERLDADLRAALRLDPADQTEGYFVRRTTFFCGRPIVGCGWGEEMLLRLFRTGRAELISSSGNDGAQLHETWRVAGNVFPLAGQLLHDSYPTVASYREKFARYTSLEAEGGRPALLGALLTLLAAGFRFPWLFFVKRGYVDGWRGFVIALGSTLYPLAVLAKSLRR